MAERNEPVGVSRYLPNPKVIKDVVEEETMDNPYLLVAKFRECERVPARFQTFNPQRGYDNLPLHIYVKDNPFLGKKEVKAVRNATLELVIANTTATYVAESVDLGKHTVFPLSGAYHFSNYKQFAYSLVGGDLWSATKKHQSHRSIIMLLNQPFSVATVFSSCAPLWQPKSPNSFNKTL